jgi:hypothetical protein
MDKTISITITCGNNIIINFILNVNPVLHLIPAPVGKRYYGEINVYLNMIDGPPVLKNKYEFANFTSIIPRLKKNYVGNFIVNIEDVLSMLQVVQYINQNPWLSLETALDATPPKTPYYVNLKTNESFWECPAGIHPWTTRVNEGGRTYYVNSLTNEISWDTPGQTDFNDDVLREIIECLQTGKTQSDLKSEIDKSLELFRVRRRLEIDAKTMNTKIDTVIVIRGHSYCGIEKHVLEEDMCLLTLSLLRDIVRVKVSRFMHDNGSRITKVFESSPSQSPTVSSFVDVALELRSKRLVFPKKVSEKSIGVKCGSASKRIKFTEQFFFGGNKEKRFLEGIFMFTKDRPKPVDISSWNELLTPNGNLYEETTEFQKRIIEFESQQPPQSTVSELELERHFASQANAAAAADDENAKAAAEAKASEEFKTEWKNLQLQRMSFCISLGADITEEGIKVCMMSCKGVDVMDLQRYYDNIVDWERRHKNFAFDYFEENSNGIKDFMKEFRLGPDDPKNKKIEGALMLLSFKRKEQVIKKTENMNKDISRDDKEIRPLRPLEMLDGDYQVIPSSYQEERSSDILKKLHQMFPRKKILVILEGCRVVPNDDGDPYDSEDGSSEKVRRGGEKRNIKKQNMKSCKNKIKKQNMKSCKNKIKKQNMKSCKNKIKKQNMKSYKNKK